MTEQEQSMARQNQEYRKLEAQQYADKVGIQTQQEEVSERKYNPGFFEETSELDADTEMYPWLENILGSKASKAHVLGNRPEEFAEQQLHLNRNEAERMIAEREPGYLLKKNPAVMAVYQGTTDVSIGPTGKLRFDDADTQDPITMDRERRQYRDLAQLLTTRESLAIEGRFVDALTTATTESRVQDKVEEESSGTKRRLRSALR